MLSDPELLRSYLKEGSEKAFAELVERYLGLVYWAAMRQLRGDTNRAREVSQEVFTRLARRAASLTGRSSLAGWLHTATRFVSRESLRSDRRRWVREKESHNMQEIFSNEADAATMEWECLRPSIDAVLEELNARDRELVLLRFFANLPLATIGAKLGISENTARMRVDRALDKLRTRLSRAGITSTSTALAMFLADQAAGAVPTGLAASIAGAALEGALTSDGWAGAKAATFWKTMSTAKTITIAASIVAILGMSLGIYWTARKPASRGLSRESGEHSQMNTDYPQVSKPASKPGPVTAAPEKQQQQIVLAPGMRAIASFQNIGFATPQAAIETEIWARVHADIDLLAKCTGFTPEGRHAAQEIIDKMSPDMRNEYGTPERMAAMLGAANIEHFAGAEVASETAASPSAVNLNIQLQRSQDPSASPSSLVATVDWQYQQTNDGWQRIIPTTLVTGWAKYFATGALSASTAQR